MSAGDFGLFFKKDPKNEDQESDRNDAKSDASLPVHEIKSPSVSRAERRAMMQDTRSLTQKQTVQLPISKSLTRGQQRHLLVSTAARR
jgi:hypothetical protein